MENLVTIKIFTNLQELHLAKNYLESEGIMSFEFNELHAQVMPHFNNASGGAQLKVNENDVEAAIELLIKGGYATYDDYEASPEIKSIERIIAKIKSLFK